jgi:hypothetical protein
MKSIPQGAATGVFLAASPLANRVTGEYRVARGSRCLADPEMARHLRAVSKD